MRQGLHIFLESNYKLVSWLKKFEKKYTVYHLVVRNQVGISILIKFNMAVNSILISH